jgi:UDP-N-acetylglucosamine 2-epimerase (non-hydrolysing)
MKNPIVLVVGTRAETIKLLPVYLALKQAGFPTLLCATFQHSELLKQVCNIFKVIPDFNLGIMRKNQDLFYITQAVLEKTRKVYQQVKPSLVIVHGDTTTTMAAALAAFYLHIPIAHVEAGLRTGDMQAPFPEEMNRKVVGQIANYHFAPTAFSTANLLAEGVARERVFCTGNTIVDALYWIRNCIRQGSVSVDQEIVDHVTACKQQGKKMVLLTAHRRESFNGGLLRVFQTIKQFAYAHPDVEIFYPYHPNPNVIAAIEASKINNISNVWIHKPLLYKDLIYLLMAVDWVATDSGGIQEEAVSLGKLVLVLRDKTERWEGVWEGSEILVGTNKKRLLEKMEEIYKMDDASITPSSVYGDGNASKTIVSILSMKLGMPLALSDAKRNQTGKSHRSGYTMFAV